MSRFTLVIAIVAVLALFATPALGCRCMPPNWNEIFNSKDPSYHPLVVYGVVTGIEHAPVGMVGRPSRYLFTVDSVFKGDSKYTDKVLRFLTRSAGTPTSCDFDMKQYGLYVISLTEDAMDGEYRLTMCSPMRAFNNEEEIATFLKENNYQLNTNDDDDDDDNADPVEAAWDELVRVSHEAATQRVDAALRNIKHVFDECVQHTMCSTCPQSSCSWFHAKNLCVPTTIAPESVRNSPCLPLMKGPILQEPRRVTDDIAWTRMPDLSGNSNNRGGGGGGGGGASANSGSSSTSSSEFKNNISIL